MQAKYRLVNSYCLRVRGNNAEPTYIRTTPAKLVGAILQAGMSVESCFDGEGTNEQLPAARQLQLYSVPPHVPGLDAMPLRRDESRVSSSSRPMSASSSGRPRSVIEFMRSPGGSVNSSPRRTLSKASKSSTIDSRHAASIFSGEYASTAQTSAMSQDDHGSPYKRPISSLSRPPSSAPGSVPQHHRQNSEGSRYFRATSAEPERTPFVSHADASGKVPQRPQSAMAHIKHEDTEESLNLSTDDAYDPNALARSRSDGQLYKSSSSQSIPRSRSGTVSRSASTQSMRIEEEDEEEVLHCRFAGKTSEVSAEANSRSSNTAVPSRTPERALSPPLQRSGTISRPMGPRQLGSRSPAASPQPMPIARPSHEEPRSRTPSPFDEDPFLPLSHRKKRFYESEANDDDSFSSKRGLRELQDGSTEVYSKSTTPDQSDRYKDSSARTAEVIHLFSNHETEFANAEMYLLLETRSYVPRAVSCRIRWVEGAATHWKPA